MIGIELPGSAVRAGSLAVLWLLLGAGCVEIDPTACVTSYDCAAGQACVDGHCAVAAEDGSHDGTIDTPDPGTDTSVDPTDGDSTDGDSAGGEATDGEATDGDSTDGEATDGDSTDGDSTDGEETTPEVEPAAPVITILSPRTTTWYWGEVVIEVSVDSGEVALDESSLFGMVDKQYRVDLKRSERGTYVGRFDTFSITNDSETRLLDVYASNIRGRVGQARTGLPIDNSIALRAEVEQSSVAAGMVIVARCTGVRRSDVLVDDTPIVGEVTPLAGVEVESNEDGTLRFIATAAGDYAITCSAPDTRSAIRDSVAGHVTVVPGPLVAVDTASQGSVSASVEGQGLSVACSGRDAFGNPVAGVTYQVEVGADLQAQTHDGQQFVVSGTVAGMHAVACRSDAWIDDTPLQIEFLPGAPVEVTATSTVSQIRAGTPVEVGCGGLDQYGNRVQLQTFDLSVVPPYGWSNEYSGVSVLGASVSIERVGAYYVWCDGAESVGSEAMTPFLLDVVPNLPARWEVTVGDTHCLHAAHPMPIEYALEDRYGNAISAAAGQVTLSTEPANAVRRSDDGDFIIDMEGRFTYELTVDGETDPGGSLEPVRGEVLVDSEPPRLSVESVELNGEKQPLPRGTQLQGGGFDAANVEVTIIAEDALSEVIDIRLEDPEVLWQSTAGEGGEKKVALATTKSSPWGMTMLTGMAKDSCGNVGYLAHSFLRSPTYYPVAGSDHTAARVDGAVRAYLSQPAIDDGDRSTLNDVASIGEAVLNNFSDWDTVLPPGVELQKVTPREACRGKGWLSTQLAYTISRDANASRKIELQNVTLGSMQAYEGGITFGVDIGRIRLPLEVWAVLNVCGFGKPNDGDWGHARFSVGADDMGVSGRFNVFLRSEAASASLDPHTFGLNYEAYFQPDCHALRHDYNLPEQFCGVLADAVVGIMNRDDVKATLKQMIPDVLGPTVEDMLTSFELANTFTMALNDSVQIELALQSGLDRIQFKGPEGSGFGDFGLWAQVAAPSRGISSGISTFGSIGAPAPSAPISFDLAPGQTFGVALRTDLLNQVLWAAWYGGNFHIDDAKAILGTDPDGAFSGLESLSIASHLPPVLMPTPNAGGALVAWGDVEINATIDLQKALPLEQAPLEKMNIRIFASVAAGGQVDIDPGKNAILLILDSDSDIAMQITPAELPYLEGPISALIREAFHRLVPNLFLDSLATVPMPTFDITQYVGETDVLELINADIEQTPSHIRLQGALQ